MTLLTWVILIAVVLVVLAVAFVAKRLRSRSGSVLATSNRDRGAS